MTHVETIAARAAALAKRAPHRRFDLAERAELLGALGEMWLRSHTLRNIKQPVIDACGYSRKMLRWGLDQACKRWTAEQFQRLVALELGPASFRDNPSHHPDAPVALVPDVIGQVLASTVPPAAFEAIVLSLLAGSSVLVRPAQSMQGLVEAFVDSLTWVSEDLARAVEVVDFPSDDEACRDAFGMGCDALVVHGSDEAIATWRTHRRPWIPMVAYGHRVSAAAIDSHALDARALTTAMTGLAEDMCAWDQTGCLSPHTLYVLGDNTEVGRVVDALLDALPAVEALHPPATTSMELDVVRQNHVRTAAFSRRLSLSANGTALLVADTPVPLRPGPGHRVLTISPVEDIAQLLEMLGAAAPHLQCLGTAGEIETEALMNLADAGLNRICALGQMQRPPLTWLHDGIGSIRPLVRFVSV